MRELAQFLIGTIFITLAGLIAYVLCLCVSFLTASLLGYGGTNQLISGLPVIPAVAAWVWVLRRRSRLLDLSREQEFAQSAISLMLLTPMLIALVGLFGMDFDF